MKYSELLRRLRRLTRRRHCHRPVVRVASYLALGQRQAIYLVKGDGPRPRTVRMTVF